MPDEAMTCVEQAKLYADDLCSYHSSRGGLLQVFVACGQLPFSQFISAGNLNRTPEQWGAIRVIAKIK